MIKFKTSDLTNAQIYELEQVIKDDNYGIYVLAVICKVLQYMWYYSGVAAVMSIIGITLPFALNAAFMLFIWLASFIALVLFVMPYYIKAVEK